MMFDDILREIGEFGSYQKRVYILAVLPTIMVAFETMSVIFIFNIPDHRCRIPGYASDTFFAQNESHSFLINNSIPRANGNWDRCHVFNDTFVNVTVADYEHVNGSYDVKGGTQLECDSWVYDSTVFDSTIATDFNVVCKQSLMRATSNMLSEVGTLCGIFIIGFMSDKFGRKLPFYLGGLAMVGGGFGIAFTTTFIALNVCRFILGFARMAIFVNGIVIGVEIVGPSKRTFAGVVIEFVWVGGQFLLLIFAYLIRNWRYLEIAVSVPSLGLLFYWWLIPESPRWLNSKGRVTEALTVLKRIAKSNKTQLPEEVEAFGQLEKQDNEEHFSIKEALKSKELLKRLVIVFIYMFVALVTYYGLTLNITNLSGDIFVNFAIAAVMETLAYICSMYLLDKLGRKPVAVGSMLLSGLACILAVLPVYLETAKWLVVTLSMVGKFACSISFAAIYIYGAELFPTVMRTSAMGLGVTFSRFGSISSPFIADLGLFVGGRFRDSLPMLVMGFPALIAGLLSLWLPETLHCKLPDTLKDLQKSSTLTCGCCGSPQADDDDLPADIEKEKDTTTC